VERAQASGGEIPHPIRFTANNTQHAYIWPARHYASSSTNPNHPPMGLRFRLKASVDISGFSPRMQVILRTMKKYGMIVADNGGNWFFQGTHDNRWDDGEINTLKNLHGRDFEAVDISVWTGRQGFDPNSAAVPPATPVSSESGIKISPDAHLSGNAPNPFNASTTIDYTLNKVGRIRLWVEDITGKEIQVLVDGVHQEGSYMIEWDGRNSNGQRISSGIYFCHMRFGNGGVCHMKMIAL
jgi:hypothetical protein